MPRNPAMAPSHPSRLRWGGATIGAFGVVFGDIGTSPIYTIQTIFNPQDPHPVDGFAESVYGLLSWSSGRSSHRHRPLRRSGPSCGQSRRGRHLVADHLAPWSAVQRRQDAPKTNPLLLATLGVFGASLFLADSMITPAISVLVGG